VWKTDGLNKYFETDWPAPVIVLKSNKMPFVFTVKLI
jgi:hypothetical protein